MAPREYRPGKKVVAAAVLTVAATYVYFLIFAQFGFLKTVLVVAGEGREAIKPIMATMGLAGLAGSALAAVVYNARQSSRLLAAGFVGCAAAAGLSQVAKSAGWLYPVAALVGLGTGFTTVTLASSLRLSVGGKQLGTIIGVGTGLAYGLCNLPVVFTAGASGQAGMAMLAAGAGFVGASALTFDAPPHVPEGFDYSFSGQGMWVLIFLALVGMDSLAFYIIQHTPRLAGETWSGAWRLEIYAGLHLVAAQLTGLALDRRWLGQTVGVGALALLTACWMIDERVQIFAEGALFYTVGVSVYSTVLVFYPARGLRPWLTALIYGVAGWGGSALGIGLAEGRHVLPHRYILAAGVIILGALLARYNLRRREVNANF